MTQHRSFGICLSALAVLLLLNPTASASSAQPLQTTFGVTINPSTVTIKVGDKAQINVTITNPGLVKGTQVCFTLDGFPSSGFTTSFNPECSDSKHGFGTILTVEVTPAAAPQTVTAYVIASSSGQSAQAILNLSVEPAMAAWIPWLGLILFFAVLGVAIFWGPKLPEKKTKDASKRGKRGSVEFSQRTT
jgi:uncharacterized membrane protein